MRIMDDAFEYLMPNVAKKKNGQFFTPRYVIDMCVKMLNPTRKEFVLDPACGSAGFLVHVLDHVWPADTDSRKEERKHGYAAQYLWGIDFDERSAKVSRALMLIAGDGRSHVFRANSLDPREWFTNRDGESLRLRLRESGLLEKKPRMAKVVKEAEAWEYFRDFRFDLILTNPPFAGEIRDRELLRRYNLAKPALERKSKKELKKSATFSSLNAACKCSKPGGRMAVILPQGKFNNASLAFIREWLLKGDGSSPLLVCIRTRSSHTQGRRRVCCFYRNLLTNNRALCWQSKQACRTRPQITSKAIANLIANGPGDLSEADLPQEIADVMAEKFGEENGEDEELNKETQPTTIPGGVGRTDRR